MTVTDMKRQSSTLEPRHALNAPASGAPAPGGRWYAWTAWAVTLLAMAFIGLIAVVSAQLIYCNFGWENGGLDYKWWSAYPLYGAAAALGAVVGVVAVGRFLTWANRRIGSLAFLIGLLVLAGGLRVACVTAVPYKPSRDFARFHESGAKMARDWTLGIHADSRNKSYRCFFPPGQVFSLGVLYSLTGAADKATWNESHGLLLAQLWNALQGTLTVLGIYYLGRRFFSEQVGRIAGVLAALLPSSIFGCMLLGAEVPEAFWLVAALCVYARWMYVEPGAQADVKQPRLRTILIAGALCGVLLAMGMYVRPTYMLLPFVLGVHMLLSWRAKRHALAAAAVMTLGLALSLAPWTFRNYLATGGGFVLISSNGGGNLYSANNPWARGDYNDRAWRELYANGPDDVSLDWYGKQKAKEWILAHPGDFLRLSLRKFVLFWHTDKEVAWWALGCPREDFGHEGFGVSDATRVLGEGGSTGFYAVLFPLGLVGLLRNRRALLARRSWILILLLCMYFTAIHMVFESQGKYHFMLVPLLCLLAALAGWSSRSDGEAAAPKVDRQDVPESQLDI